MGTPGYMPPEQAAGDTRHIGPAADIYSLGAVLYCLLTGRPPFQSSSAIATLLPGHRARAGRAPRAEPGGRPRPGDDLPEVPREGPEAALPDGRSPGRRPRALAPRRDDPGPAGLVVRAGHQVGPAAADGRLPARDRGPDAVGRRRRLGLVHGPAQRREGAGRARAAQGPAGRAAGPCGSDPGPAGRAGRPREALGGRPGPRPRRALERTARPAVREPPRPGRGRPDPPDPRTPQRGDRLHGPGRPPPRRTPAGLAPRHHLRQRRSRPATLRTV